MQHCYSTRSTYHLERNRTIKSEWYKYEGDILEFARQWSLSLSTIAKIITSDRRKIIKLLRQKEQIDEQLVNLLKREIYTDKP